MAAITKKKARIRKRFLTAFTAARRTHTKHNTSATEDIKYRSQHHCVTMTTKVHIHDNRCPEDAAWLLASLSKEIIWKSINLKHPRSVTLLKTDYDDGRFGLRLASKKTSKEDILKMRTFLIFPLIWCVRLIHFNQFPQSVKNTSSATHSDFVLLKWTLNSLK